MSREEVPPGYRNTEVGMIPEDWDVKNIGDITSIYIGRDLREKNYSTFRDDEYQYPVFSNTVDNEGLYGYYNISEYDGESLTVVGRGVGVGTAFKRSGGYGAIGRLIVIFPQKNINSNYLVYQINFSLIIHEENTGVPQLTGISLSKYNLPIPQLPEQTAIAAALSDADALISSLDTLIDKKRAIKQAAMQQLLTGKKRLPGFEGDWEELNIAQSSVLKARIGWQGLTTAEYLDTGDYYLVTGTDFDKGRVDWNRCWSVDRSRYIQDKNIQLAMGDVLLTKDGTIGKAGFVDLLPKPATLNSGVFVIRPKADAYEPLYMYYVLTSRIFDEFLARLQAGSTISHLYQKDFVDFTFNAPLINEQTAIATVLSDMDADITALEERRDKMIAIKQGMMQQLLTGKIRLVGPGPAEAGT